MSTIEQVEALAPSAVAVPDGYDLQADLQGFYGNIRFWVLGVDLLAFTSSVAGLPQTLTINPGGGGAGIAITRRIPLIHPYITGGNCYCNSIHAYPVPNTIASWDGVCIVFADYFVDVGFSTPQYSMESGDTPTVTITLDGGVDRVTRPGSSYLFPSDGLRQNHDVGVSVVTEDFTIANHLLPSLDNPLYSSLIDCVNLTTFFGYPPGTVLYTGPHNSGQFIIGGSPSFDCSHSFKYRSIPHNMIMRPDGKGFEAPIQSDYGGDGAGPGPANEEDLDDPIYLHPEGELNQLWGM